MRTQKFIELGPCTSEPQGGGLFHKTYLCIDVRLLFAVIESMPAQTKLVIGTSLTHLKKIVIIKKQYHAFRSFRLVHATCRFSTTAVPLTRPSRTKSRKGINRERSLIFWFLVLFWFREYWSICVSGVFLVRIMHIYISTSCLRLQGSLSDTNCHFWLTEATGKDFGCAGVIAGWRVVLLLGNEF
jgi:hypothetical protein